MDDDRKSREAEFHDDSSAADARDHLASSYYRVTGASFHRYGELVARHCAGADVLDYGCGDGTKGMKLIRAGAASVAGIDISTARVETANQRAAGAGVSDRMDFRVMDAENLEFQDGAFDLVCGTSIVHHLDIDRAYGEIRRVLRPTGIAVFLEPLGHNPLINLYRRRTPELRTPDEHPLMLGDVDAAQHYFHEVETSYFHLLSLLAVAFRKRRAFERLLDRLDGADRSLFRLAPFSRRYAWMVVMALRSPRPG